MQTLKSRCAVSSQLLVAKYTLSETVYPVHKLDVYALGKTTTYCPGCCSVRHNETFRSVSIYGGTFKKNTVIEIILRNIQFLIPL